MSELNRYKPLEKYGIQMGIAGGYAIVDFPLVAASDYDQLKADSEATADLAESRLAENLRLKAENERLNEEVRSWVIRIRQRGLEMDELSDERDTLRTQLDEALARAIKIIGWHRNEYNGAQIDLIIQAFNDAWPERNNPCQS